MHERKALMSELSDAFVMLPGGFGTYEEFMESVTWAQLGIHDKPVGLLDVAGYYAGLIAFAEHMAAVGFVRPAHRDLLIHDSDLDRLLARMAAQGPVLPVTRMAADEL